MAVIPMREVVRLKEYRFEHVRVHHSCYTREPLNMVLCALPESRDRVYGIKGTSGQWMLFRRKQIPEHAKWYAEWVE